ncbi:MFS transporter [Microvirga sp. GCM10011540]|uniref:MFS transporter n=1 Tax=Microvirga sp. GCM10011540 TaxID=3317338 RepID=UPI003621496E
MQRDAYEIGAATAASGLHEETATARAWLGVASIALGVFVVVTAEQLPIGLLTSVSGDLGVSEGQAGLMVTLPGFIAAVAAPLVPLAIGALDRRIALLGLMALMAGASVLSAFAPSYMTLLASRFLVGLSIGGFWAIAGGLAPRLVPAASVPRATSLIFGGVAAASVLGIPIGTLIGEYAGWRSAFIALAVGSALVIAGMLVAIPRLRPERAIGVTVLATQLKSRAVASGLLVTLLLVTAQFATYTYISPTAQSLMGIGSMFIGPLLLGYGIAGVLGNFIIGMGASRNVATTMLIISLALATLMTGIAAVARHEIAGVLFVLAWGFVYGGVSVSLQTWMLRAAPEAAEAATSLWVCVFNFSIALGAFVGGAAVDNIGLMSVNIIGAGLFLLSAIVAAGSRQAFGHRPS